MRDTANQQVEGRRAAYTSAGKQKGKKKTTGFLRLVTTVRDAGGDAKVEKEKWINSYQRGRNGKIET